MIRLPTSEERAKITTPNEAATSLGVSPISSVRNVMVKVKDTSGIAQDARPSRKYKTKPCKGCGGPVRTSLKKPFCTHECRNKHKPVRGKKTVVSCCVCSKEFVRLVYGDKEKFCCSLDCQRKWSLVKNRGGGNHTIDWVRRSEKAKLRWKKTQSQIRRHGEGNWVIRLCIKGSRDSTDDNPDWVKRKCRSASSMLTVLVFKEQKLFERKEIKVYSWNRFCKVQLNRCYRKWMRGDATWLHMKCITTSGNWRRKLRD